MHGLAARARAARRARRARGDARAGARGRPARAAAAARAGRGRDGRGPGRGGDAASARRRTHRLGRLVPPVLDGDDSGARALGRAFLYWMQTSGWPGLRLRADVVGDTPDGLAKAPYVR